MAVELRCGFQAWRLTFSKDFLYNTGISEYFVLLCVRALRLRDVVSSFRRLSIPRREYTHLSLTHSLTYSLITHSSLTHSLTFQYRILSVVYYIQYCISFLISSLTSILECNNVITDLTRHCTALHCTALHSTPGLSVL